MAHKEAVEKKGTQTEVGTITGDVVATADLKINTKGGSTTATLKKAIRDRLGELGRHVKAATVEFGTGQAVLLITGAAGTAEERAPLRVRRVSKNRFEIEIEGDGEEEVSEVTAAFLRLKKDLFAKGKLQLAVPVNADQWRSEMDKRIEAAEAALSKATNRNAAG